MSKKKVISLTFAPEQLRRIDDYAAYMGLSRSSAISSLCITALDDMVPFCKGQPVQLQREPEEEPADQYEQDLAAITEFSS